MFGIHKLKLISFVERVFFIYYGHYLFFNFPIILSKFQSIRDNQYILIVVFDSVVDFSDEYAEYLDILFFIVGKIPAYIYSNNITRYNIKTSIFYHLIVKHTPTEVTSLEFHIWILKSVFFLLSLNKSVYILCIVLGYKALEDYFSFSKFLWFIEVYYHSGKCIYFKDFWEYREIFQKLKIFKFANPKYRYNICPISLFLTLTVCYLL